MIRLLAVEGFKSLLNVSLETRRLTVLVGGNASGKSSAIQALLLLRQSCDQAGSVGNLSLSGALYEGGTADDIVHPLAPVDDHKARIVSMSLVEHPTGSAVESGREIYRFRYNRESDAVSNRVLEGMPQANSSRLCSQVSGSTNNFAYLGAERVGPRVSYPLPSNEPIAGTVGKSGEFTAALFARALKEDRTIDANIDRAITKLIEELKPPQEIEGKEKVSDDQSTTTDFRLTTIANKTLSWVIPGAAFKVEEQTPMDAAQLSFYRIDRKDPKPERPTHVGFGLTYVLPVIGAALAINPDGLLLIENPESHLHPLSQSRIGAFLAAVSSVGPQILLETHSDHVVNGIRLAVKLGIISCSDVVFQYFQKTPDGSATTVHPVEVEADGTLAEWPVGFFDQIANDLSRL